LRAEIAFSASRSYQIPTKALQIRMVKMTAGSTQEGTECSCSSSLAITKGLEKKISI